jgi:hypothetical protein
MLAILSPGFPAAQRRKHAEREASAADQPRVRRDGGQIEAGLVRAGEALGEAFGNDGFHRLLEALLRWRRDQRADQVLRQVDQDPGGLAALIFLDAPTLRVIRVARYAGGRERRGAGPRRMAIHAHQRHRMPGRGAVK